MHGQLDGGKQNIGTPWLRYKNKLKANLAALLIDKRILNSMLMIEMLRRVFHTIETNNSLRRVFKNWKKQGLKQKQIYQKPYLSIHTHVSTVAMCENLLLDSNAIFVWASVGWNYSEQR